MSGNRAKIGSREWPIAVLSIVGMLAVAGALVLAFFVGLRLSAPAHGAGWTLAAALGMGLCVGGALLVSYVFIRQSLAARKRVEDELRNNARHLQLVLDTIPDRIWVRDGDGRYVQANRAEALAQGMTVEALLGKTNYDLQPVETAQAVEQEDAKVMASGLPLRIERRSNLGGVWIEVIKVPFVSADGGTSGLLGVARDVSARKVAETSRAMLSALEDHRAVAIFERSLDGTIRSWSAGAHAMLGFSVEEAIGKPDHFSLPPDEPITIEESRARLLRGESFSTTSRRLTRDGRILHVIGSHAPIRDGTGDVVGSSILLQDVTALREAQIRATQEEGRYRALFEYSPMPVLIWEHASGRIADANEAALATWGYSREELLALSISDLHDPEFSGEYSGFIEQMPQDRTFRALPRRHITKDGRRLHMEVSSAPIDWHGPANRVSVLHDVSDRQRAEETMREARSFLLQTLDSFPGMLAVIDNEHRPLFINRAVADYFGVDAQTLLTRPRGPDNGRDWLRGDELFNCESVLITRQRADAEVRRDRGKDGVQWFQTLRVPLMQPSGMAGVLSIIIDITEQRAAREALATERNLLQSILSTIPDFLFVKDREGRYVMLNRLPLSEIRQGVPHDPAKLIGLKSSDIFHPTDRERMDREDRTLLDSGQAVLNREGYRDTAAGRQWWITSKVPLRDTQGKIIGLIGIGRDVTALKLASAQIQLLNAELEQRVADRTAQLMAANRELEAFAFSVSHDLRAPLRGIDGFSQSLVDEYSAQLPEQARDYLLRVRSASRRMGELIDGMLALSRLAQTELAAIPLDLSAMAGEIAGELKALGLVSEGVIGIAPGMRARGDPRLLRIVLENLIGNAVKFSSRQAVPHIEVGTMFQNSEQVYFVRDNGVGFDMEHADKLFAVFRRLHSEREFPGNGVGLATVQRVVQRHGGRVWAHSERDCGAVFYFTLRATPAAVSIN